jgi:hypothetical protein
VVDLGSTYAPSGDARFSRFEAECAADVRDVTEIAGVPFGRLVEATELGVMASGHHQKGGSA